MSVACVCVCVCVRVCACVCVCVCVCVFCPFLPLGIFMPSRPLSPCPSALVYVYAFIRLSKGSNSRPLRHGLNKMLNKVEDDLRDDARRYALLGSSRSLFTL